MDKKRRIMVAGVGASLALSVVGGSAAAAPLPDPAPQEVTAVVNTALSMTNPNPSIDLGALDPLQTGTATDSFSVTSNVPYTVTITSTNDKLASAGTAPDELTADLTVSSTPTGLGAVGGLVTSTVASTTGGVIGANGLGGLATFGGGGTDSYTLDFSQPIAVTDLAGEYSLDLTYTAGSLLP